MPIDPELANDMDDANAELQQTEYKPTAPPAAPAAVIDPFAGEESLRLDQASLKWARDVYWVFENYSAKVTKAVAQSSARWGLYSYAKKNCDQFMGQLVPKAMMILEKNAAKGGDAEVVVIEERKSVVELQRILRDALAEAAGAFEGRN